MPFCPCCCSSKSNKWRLTCVGITSVVLIVFGALLYSIYRAAYVAIIKEQSDLREGSLLYPQWVEPQQIVDVGFFMFNLTNAEEFASQPPGEFVKPILERKGPYVYRVTIKKDHLQPLETTPKEIAFRQTFNFYYKPELTVGSAEDDIITTINYFALSLGPLLDYLFSLPEAANISQITKKAIYRSANAAISNTNSTLLLKYPAGEILFGMRDPLYARLAEIINNLLENMGLPPILSDEFGFFKVLNNSLGWHDYQTYTGDPEYWLTNLITRLDGQKNLSYWYGDSCNMMNGSDGTVRPPFGNRDELVYHLYPSACRSTYVKYVRDTTVKGIPVWEYKPPPEMFKAPAHSDYNKCFCEENSTELSCTHDGGIHLRPCTFGVPIYISAPHFLHGDGYFLSKLEGVDPPDEDIHSTVYSYEPSIGAALGAKKTLQFNIYMTPHPEISTAGIIEETFVYPLFWLNGTYVVSDKDANILYGLIVIFEIVVICLQLVLIGIGTALLCYLVYYQLTRRKCSLGITMDELAEPKVPDDSTKSKRQSTVYGQTNGSFIRKT